MTRLSGVAVSVGEMIDGGLIDWNLPDTAWGFGDDVSPDALVMELAECMLGRPTPGGSPMRVDMRAYFETVAIPMRPIASYPCPACGAIVVECEFAEPSPFAGLSRAKIALCGHSHRDWPGDHWG